MPLPPAVARANRAFVNPVVRRVAGRAPALAVVRHRGRRSGTMYETPVNVFRPQFGPGLVTALTYGSGTDWMKNLAAAGGGTLRHRGRDTWVRAPVLIPTAEGMAAMPRAVRPVLRALDVTGFIRWEEEPAGQP